MSARVKVSLAFQLSEDAAVQRRKKVLTFQAEDSLQQVYETISGCLGGAPLWPKDFGDLLQDGNAVAQFFFNPGEDQGAEGSPNAIWHPAPPGGHLGDLVRGSGAGAVADLLLRIVEPVQRDAGVGKEEEVSMYYSNTFLHIKEDDDSKAPTPKALSDPGSYHCSTPMSRVGSEAPNIGLEEQAEVEKKHRRTCEEYIQTKLWPHMGTGRRADRSENASENGEQPPRRNPLSCRSPLRIGTPVLNIETSSLTRRPMEHGEPAYLAPASPPRPTTSLATSSGTQQMQAPQPCNHPVDLRVHPGSPAQEEGTGGLAAFPDGVPTQLQRKPWRHMESPRELWEGSELGDGIVHNATGSEWPGMAAPQPGMAAPQPGMMVQPLQQPMQPPLQPPMQPPLQPPHVAAVEDEEEDGLMMSGFSHQIIPGGSGMLNPDTAEADELFDVVSRNNISALQHLLNSSVDVNKCTARGSHVLFRAVIKARELDIVHMLLHASADVRTRDEKGSQVMHFWARATVGRHFLLDMGKALIAAGADVNAQRYHDGMSPLHNAVVGHNNRRGWLDFHKALMLVRHGANIHLCTHLGQVPLSLVNVDGRAATKKLIQLLQYGIPEGVTDWPRCDHVGCPWCS